MKDVTITLDECQVEMLVIILNDEIMRYEHARLKSPADNDYRGAVEELQTIRDMLTPAKSYDPNWYFK